MFRPNKHAVGCFGLHGPVVPLIMLRTIEVFSGKVRLG